jgi:hypothetical protein
MGIRSECSRMLECFKYLNASPRYAVAILPVSASKFARHEASDSSTGQTLLYGVLRNCSQVKKVVELFLFFVLRANETLQSLLLCYVIYPDHLSPSKLEDMNCITQYSIHEVVLSRWLPERTRN